MIKLLLIILLSILLFALGFYVSANKTTKIPDSVNNPINSSPADTIQRANDAVQKTQDLQNKLNQKAADQLGQ